MEERIEFKQVQLFNELGDLDYTVVYKLQEHATFTADLMVYDWRNQLTMIIRIVKKYGGGFRMFRVIILDDAGVDELEFKEAKEIVKKLNSMDEPAKDIAKMLEDKVW